MSNFNYMDNVPVKIAEKFKPPPRIYQLPQFVINKLHLPDEHYYKDPAYNYDFQLEKKVRTKIPEYRRMRQIEREARQTRREKREQDRQRQIEENHKQMLAQCSYPNAAELSSSESEDEENSNKANPADKIGKVILNKDKNWQHHNFDSILQPTVLTLGGDVGEVNKDSALAALEKNLANQSNQNDFKANNSTEKSVDSNSKLANTFNYKDFEEDTSSPFDNIELKTINDLDILAQVLHNTQMKANNEINEVNGEMIEKTEESKKFVENSAPIEALQTTIEHTKATLDKVNFSDINLELTPRQQNQNDNIPNQHFTNNTFQPSDYNFVKNIPQQNNYQIYHNQNFLYSPNCNRLQQATDNIDLQQMHYIGNNIENNYNILSATNDQVKHTSSYHNAPKSQQISQIQQDELLTSKSKSVPDILRELRDEVRNCEMRRTRLRNHSFNQSDEVEEKDKEDQIICPKDKNTVSSDKCLQNLAVEVQYLAKNISSMGFPLERVAKVANIYGDDDKKIIEHLIPLTELLDLGFEETRISDALVKFDNNKEKALEHLIS